MTVYRELGGKVRWYIDVEEWSIPDSGRFPIREGTRCTFKYKAG
jgi:hypothetical protein